MSDGGFSHLRSHVDRRSVLREIAVSGFAFGAVVGRADGRSGRDRVTTTIDPLLVPAAERSRDGLPNEIRIENTGSRTDRVEYRLVVDGRLELGDDAGENEAVEDGNAVSGAVEGVGRDTFHFSGTVTTFEITTGADVATVLLDGEEVDDPTGLPGTDPGAERCVEIRPLRFEDTTVVDFYGYTPDPGAPNPRQSNTPTTLERPGVSRLFLYEGPGGSSLVIIHGGGEGEEGGAASFEISGLPSDGEWVVLDDGYEGSGDVFEIGETRSSLHWAWGVQGRNDGAAFCGLGDEFRVRIDPAFNEAARLEPFGSGQVEAWEVLSGSATDPDVIPVAMDEPIVIASGDRREACPPVDGEDAEGDIGARIVDLSVTRGTFEPGGVVPAHVTVRNTGGQEHTFFVGYSVFDPNGDDHHNDGTTDEPVTLGPGETRTTTVEWTVENDVPSGRYAVQVIVWRDRQDDTLDTPLDRRDVDSVFEVRGTE